MNPTTTTTSLTRKKPVKRSVYSAPVLREFGAVGALTQSGTGPNAEMGAMMNTMQRP